MHYASFWEFFILKRGSTDVWEVHRFNMMVAYTTKESVREKYLSLFLNTVQVRQEHLFKTISMTFEFCTATFPDSAEQFYLKAAVFDGMQVWQGK